MVLNHLQPPFDNAAIRRALLGAFSQSDFMRAAIGDDRSLWSDEAAVFSPGTPMDSRSGVEIMTGPRDIVRARRDIQAAGDKGERTVLLGAADLPPENAYANITADMLHQLGMNVDLLPIDWATTGATPGESAADRGGRVERILHQFDLDEQPRPRKPFGPA